MIYLPTAQSKHACNLSTIDVGRSHVKFDLKVHTAEERVDCFDWLFHWLENHLHTDHQVLIGLERSEGTEATDSR